jgi:hypothetical protein
MAIIACRSVVVGLLGLSKSSGLDGEIIALFISFSFSLVGSHVLLGSFLSPLLQLTTTFLTF